ncbi:NTP transferase domain-containing protein [Candidatus Pelagibacter sp.]|nr:NTP transferase domain-containing protein [Candidatus Pelagibacter sp.]
MHLVLLAAGKSKRIYSDLKKHKCLIKIGNKSLIEKIISNANKNNINQQTIISGFKSFDLKKALNKKYTYIFNKYFQKYEMVYSILLALKNINDDLIISYTDIFYDEKLFKKISKKKFQNITVPVNYNWKKVWKIRKKDILDDAETLKIKNNKIVEIGNKIQKVGDVEGQFMGILIIPNHIRQKLIKIILKNKLYKKQTTYFIEFLIKMKFEINPLSFKSFWYEFDDILDFKNFKEKQ